MSVEIGAIIKKILKSQGLTQKKLGILINRHDKTVAGILNRKTIDTALLLAISNALQHDFFQYYYANEPLKSFREAELSSLHKEIEVAKNTIIEKESFIITQTKYLSTLEDYIHLLKEKN